MRRCILCIKDKEDVVLLRVVPAAWTGFNNFAGICGECRASDAYRKMMKQGKILSRPPEPAAQASETAEGAATE